MVTLYQFIEPDPLTALNMADRALKTISLKSGLMLGHWEKKALQDALGAIEKVFQGTCRVCFKPSKEMYCLKCDHLMGDL